jgi:hypothetical protein
MVADALLGPVPAELVAVGAPVAAAGETIWGDWVGGLSPAGKAGRAVGWTLSAAGLIPGFARGFERAR